MLSIGRVEGRSDVIASLWPMSLLEVTSSKITNNTFLFYNYTSHSVLGDVRAIVTVHVIIIIIIIVVIVVEGL